MYASDITLGTTTFSLRTQRVNSSIRSDATQPLNEPNTLTISHDVAGSGRVSSAVMLDDVKVVQVGTSSPVADTVRVMLKVQYNPVSGRVDIDDDVNALIAELVAFLGTPANVVKLLNRES